MPNIPFYMAGQSGIIKDIAPHELPPHSWSDGRNIRFRDGKAIRREGQVRRYGLGQLGQPFWIMLTYTPNNVYWVYADQTKLYATDGAAHDEVTRGSGPYGAVDISRMWDGGMFSGIPVITNGKDKPQAWPSPGLGTNFVDLANWPATYTCRVIRPYKNFLVAMYLTKGGNTLPNTILWSHPADPGSVPVSWDITDPTKLAGERDLPDTFTGGIRNAMELRDNLIIYKDNSIWGMQFIGGTNMFRTWMILGGIGTLGAHCVAPVNKGQQHLVATSDDLVVFDGQTTQSILDNKWKKYIDDNIDDNVSERSFVISYERQAEAWFCYPENGQQFPNRALIWNWTNNTISQRELGGMMTSAAVGPVIISGDPWDLDSGTWDSDTTIWDTAQFRASKYDLLMTKPGSDLASSRILQVEIEQQYDGVDYTSYLERTDIALIGQDRDGQPKADFDRRKIATRLKLHIEGSPVKVKLGSQEKLGGGVVWDDEQTFTPGIDDYVDFYTNGMFIAIHIESRVGGEFKLSGFDLNIEPLGGL